MNVGTFLAPLLDCLNDALDFPADGIESLRTISGCLFSTSTNQVTNGLWDIRLLKGRKVEWFFDDLIEDSLPIIGVLDCPLPRQQLKEKQPECIDIDKRRNILSEYLFRRHIGRRPQHHSDTS